MRAWTRLANLRVVLVFSRSQRWEEGAGTLPMTRRKSEGLDLEELDQLAPKIIFNHEMLYDFCGNDAIERPKPARLALYQDLEVGKDIFSSTSDLCLYPESKTGSSPAAANISKQDIGNCNTWRSAPLRCPLVVRAPECSICLENFQDNQQLRVTRCEHVFHSSCLMPWLVKQKSRCPLCRRLIRIIASHERDVGALTVQEYL